MKIFLILSIFSFSLNTYADCGKVSKFLLSGISSILTSGYRFSSGDGRCGENGRLSLADLMEPDIFLRSDYHEIVRKTFLEIENDDSWNMEAMTIRKIKKYAPGEYEQMKMYLVNNIGSLASLNDYEKEVVKENPAGALWVMFNGKKAQNLEGLYNASLIRDSSEIKRENAGYLGKGDAFRHIAWNALSARFGFEDIAAKFIDAHEEKDEKHKIKPSQQKIVFEGDKSLSPSKVTDFNIQEHLMQIEMKNSNKYADFNVKQDTSMDEHNNELGRELGQELYCTFDDNEVAKRVSQAIEDGDARIVDNCLGRKHKLIKSNRNFEQCKSSILPEKNQCYELEEKISLSTPIADLEKLVSEGSSAYDVSCAYNRAMLNNILEKYKEDPKVVSILEKRATQEKKNLETKEKMEAEAKKNGTKAFFGGVPPKTIVTEEEKKFLCTKLTDEYKNMKLNDFSCDLILSNA
ncbi:hypothetical protein ABMA79_02395, partial [Halobacteriovorax sp. HFRX-2_2]|uniref:hypothetical protein n=1 Tax=unclassified Halobacteriovorax TaxID=2639665 RepID=UPI00371E7B3E